MMWYADDCLPHARFNCLVVKPGYLAPKNTSAAMCLLYSWITSQSMLNDSEWRVSLVMSQLGGFLLSLPTLICW